MMIQMPRDMAPTRIASAMLCSCTISFQRWYGVILSITMKAMTKIKIPTNAKISAATMLPRGTRFSRFASCVMVIAAVNRAVRAGIIADRLRNIFQLIDSVKAPATVLAKSGGAQSQQSIEKIEFSEHYSSSPELLDICTGGGWPLDQRERFQGETPPKNSKGGQEKREKGKTLNPRDGPL